MLKSKIFKVLVTIGIIATITMAQTSAIWNGTTNTSWYNALQNEFTITTAEQLAGLAELVNDGNKFIDKTIKLDANIMLNDTTNWRNWENNPPANEWTRIGHWILEMEYPESNRRFQGTFDGQGNVVSGMYINTSDDMQGLFGYVGGMAKDNHFGTIKNLGVIASYVKGGEYEVGLLVGMTEAAKIMNCFTSGIVKGTIGVGGLAGVVILTYISNSYSTATVEGLEWVGGLVGDADSYEIRNSYAIGNVKGNADVGGLIGTEYIKVVSSYFDSQASGQSGSMGRTTAQMKQQNTFVGWDFTNVWGINSEINNGYPYLLIFGDNNPITSITTEKIGNKKSTSFAFAGIKNGQINLRLQAGNYTAELYNLQGRMINRTNISATNGINATGLRTDNLSRGVFILNVKQAGNSVLRQKISVR